MKKEYFRHQEERNLAIIELGKETADGWDPGWEGVPFMDENRIRRLMFEIFRKKGIDLEEMDEFMDRFNFRKDGNLLVGIERECFITDLRGNIVPRSAEILSVLTDRSKFGYELSACQLEDRIGPVPLDVLPVAISENERILCWAETKMGFRRMFSEVASKDMPLDIYPDPDGRYQVITKNMSQDILEAACRVAGTHIHIGMPDHETAIRVYNKVIKESKKLIKMGDGSSGERLKIYKVMAPDFCSPAYASWEEFYSVAKEKGFSNDPRKCWNLIRISVHGTIEFRMFGATDNLDKIVEWAKICHNLCEVAMGL